MARRRNLLAIAVLRHSVATAQSDSETEALIAEAARASEISSPTPGVVSGSAGVFDEATSTRIIVQSGMPASPCVGASVRVPSSRIPFRSDERA